MSTSQREPNPHFNPHAAVAGWLLPGLGHFILGLRKRGIILAVAICSLWLLGILIGGISVISRTDRTEGSGESRSWWYYGQAMIAPSIAVDMFRNSLKESHADGSGDGSLTYEPSFGRMAEQGTLFTALAGMLNLLAIIDVLYCNPAYRRERDSGQLVLSSSAIAKAATSAAETRA
ncbi:MAG: DUF6677 family protein [Phycisphaeraceae bacterium]